MQECFALCVQQDWARSHAAKQMAATVWSGLVDTKRVLEDVFAALTHTSGRSKNLQMSRPRAFFEASVSTRLFPTGSGSPGASPPQSLVWLLMAGSGACPSPMLECAALSLPHRRATAPRTWLPKRPQGGGARCHP